MATTYSVIDIDLIRSDLQVVEWIGTGPQTALCASSGREESPLTFLQPGAHPLAKAGLAAPAPQLHLRNVGEHAVHDRCEPTTSLLLDQPGMAADRWSTRITEEWSRTIAPNVTLRGFTWHSRSERFPDRNHVVVDRRGGNETLLAAIRPHGWLPDVLIGSCRACPEPDGDLCVNDLSLRGVPPEAAQQIPIPAWWVADHFRHTERHGPIEVGTIVRSADRAFPAAFEAVAELSREGGEEPAAGALWLFRARRS